MRWTDYAEEGKGVPQGSGPIKRVFCSREFFFSPIFSHLPNLREFYFKLFLALPDYVEKVCLILYFKSVLKKLIFFYFKLICFDVSDHFDVLISKIIFKK